MNGRSAEELAAMAEEAAKHAAPLCLGLIQYPPRICWMAARVELDPDLATVDALVALAVVSDDVDFRSQPNSGRWCEAAGVCMESTSYWTLFTD